MSENAGVVVVGAGLAAAHAIDTLREGGFDGPLTLIGDEGEHPYERPPLSKAVLAGAKEPESAYVHDLDWYAERQVTLHLGDAAVNVDRDRQAVTLASGALVPYGDLVLATGASPRSLPIPGADLDGVFALRTLADSVALRAAFATSRSLVVIGAGWIGLEVAAAAKGTGLDVTVLEYADVPLSAAMGPVMGAHFAELHRRNGVEVRTGVSVQEIAGAGHVEAVRADGVDYPADLVLMGVGVSPNVALAERAGLDVNNGIVVDAQMRTSDPHIFAIGDVANAHNVALGVPVRAEHWDNAIRQGKLVAQVLLGQDQRYDWQPYFYTDQFDLGMEYVGRGAGSDDVVVRGDQASGEFLAFWLREGVVTAAMNVNIWDVSDDLRALIGQRIAPEALADADVPLAELASAS